MNWIKRLLGIKPRIGCFGWNEPHKPGNSGKSNRNESFKKSKVKPKIEHRIATGVLNINGPGFYKREIPMESMQYEEAIDLANESISMHELMKKRKPQKKKTSKRKS